MTTKIPKYTGRKFVKPFSRNVGRRTGKNIKVGKNIRVNKDGFEEFDDYMSESDADLTREHVLMRSIREESQSLEDSGKENAASNANVLVSQSVPNQSTFYNSTVSLSQLSQDGKVNNRSRFAWLRNRNIGRRTGKDVRGNKQIRRDEDGFEVFDDYLSPPSGAESFLSVSSVQSQSFKEKRRKSGLAEVENADYTEPRSPAREPSQSSFGPDSHSSQKSEIDQQEVDQTLLKRSLHRSSQKLLSKSCNESTQTLHSGSSKDHEGQSNFIRQPDNRLRQTQDPQLVQTESDSESIVDDAENEESVSGEESDGAYSLEKNSERISVRNDIDSSHNISQRGIPAATNRSVETINANSFEKLQRDKHDTIKTNSNRLKDVYEHDVNSNESDDENESYGSHSEDESHMVAHSRVENSVRGRDKLAKIYQNTDEQNVYSEVDSDASISEAESGDENPETENLVKSTVSQNYNQQNEHIDVENQSYGSEAESDHVMKINQSRKSTGQAHKSREHIAGHSARKTEKLKDKSHSEADSDIEETTEKITRTERTSSHRSVRKSDNSESVLELEDNYDDADDEGEFGPSSQTGIDVAGNRSGSITKLDVPDTSKVSFDRTRKRLSYSALELSEETKKARKSKVKSANQSLQEKSSRSESDRLSTSDRGYSRELLRQADIALSYNLKSAGRNNNTAGSRNAVSCNKTGSSSDKNKVTGNKSDLAESRIEPGRTRAETGEEYYEPSEFVCLASVARRRSTFVSSKDVDSDDDIEIFDDRKRKSVFGKSAKSNTDKKEKMDNKNDKKNKRTVKSDRKVKSDSDKDENLEGSDEKQISQNGERQITETSKSRKAQKRSKHVDTHEKSNRKKQTLTKPKRISLTDYDDSEIEIIDDLPKKKQNRKSTVESGYDPYDFHHDSNTDNEELYIENDYETDKKVSNSKDSKTVKSGVKQAKKTVIEEDGSEMDANVNKSKKKKRTKQTNAVTENSEDNDELGYVNLNEINEKKTNKKNLNKKKKSAKQEANAIVEKPDEATKPAKSIRGKRKKIIDAKAKTVGKTVSDAVKEAISRKNRSYRSLGLQSVTRKSKLKSLSSLSSLKSNKRKTINEKQGIENDVDNSVSDPKKNKLDDSDTDSQHSAKRKLEFNKKTKSARNVKRKSKVATKDNIENEDVLSPGIESSANHCISTPVADSIHMAPTNFNSGISFRVSRRSELLDNISSGYGNVPNITVEMQPTEGLTPCITKGDRSRKSKGRRVSIIVQKDGKSRRSKQSLGLGNNISRKEAAKSSRKSRTSSLGTPLPSASSSPQHYCEVTHTGTPHPGRKSLDMLADRLILPEPAPEGLRRSKRTRLKPIASYKNERIVYDRRRSDGWVIVGVKPSLEVKWGKVEEEKRRRRQLLNQIRKAMQKDSAGKRDRKLSVHVKLPEDAHPTEANEITVVNPDTEEELLMDCIATKDSHSPVGPDHGTPKKEDPYLIKQLIDQPIMSSGHLILKPGEEKPPQIVSNHAVTFMIHYGKLLVTIHNTTTLLETGDSFFVPYGSSYSIQNLRNDTATIFYVVLKRCEINDTVSTRTTTR